jgi:deoxyribose-phosphate aldolase
MTESYTIRDLAKMIDFSLLSPNITDKELETECMAAKFNDVASVCIMPYYLKRCAETLDGSDVKPSTTIGFPQGGHTTNVKVAEVRQALKDGAAELDVVINISKACSNDWVYVQGELRTITDIIHDAGQKIKVIFENCYLTDEQKIRLCEICGEVRVDWVKTSTGYAPGAGTMHDFQLMLDHVPSHVQVKAAGGVPDLDTCLKIREMGVTRVGKRSFGILEEAKQRLGEM